MSKRIADSEMDHLARDQETDRYEVDEVKQASSEIMSTRKIARPRSRLGNSSVEARKSPFSIAGSATPPPQVTSSGVEESKLKGSNLNGDTSNTLASSTTSPSFSNFGAPSAASPAIAPIADSGLVTPADDDRRLQFRALNENFSDQVSKLRETNIYGDFSGVIREYLKYSQEITADKYKKVSIQVTSAAPKEAEDTSSSLEAAQPVAESKSEPEAPSSSNSTFQFKPTKTDTTAPSPFSFNVKESSNDHTWKADQPIKFGSSAIPSESEPSAEKPKTAFSFNSIIAQPSTAPSGGFLFQNASKKPETSEITSETKPVSNIFGSSSSSAPFGSNSATSSSFLSSGNGSNLTSKSDSNTASSPSNTSSLFGAASGSALFGTPFGTSAGSDNQPSKTPSLFGSGSNGTGTAFSGFSASNSAFGASASSKPTFGGFGTSTSSTTTFGGFGTPSSSVTGSAAPALFGASTAPSLFGKKSDEESNDNKPSTPSSSLFGAPSQPSSATQSSEPAVDGNPEEPSEDSSFQVPDKYPGEEDEDKIFERNAKLYQVVENRPKLMGQGLLRLYSNKETKKSRVVIRTEKIGRIILNVLIRKDFKYGLNDPKSVSIFDLQEGKPPIRYIVAFYEKLTGPQNDAKQLLEDIENQQKLSND